MKANAQADVAPNNSKTTPRSQVSRDRDKAETTRAAVKIKCRLGW